MESGLGKLVSFKAKNDYEIIGILFQKSSFNDTSIKKHVNNRIVVHIHGSLGNFYQNKFIWYMSKIYCENGIDFLSINLSAHDGLAEGYFGTKMKYVGGSVANYEDSQLDIDAALEFVNSLGYKDILLQGHSLGCDKIIEYSLKFPHTYDLILLSPTDSYAIHSRWISPETIDEQINRLETSMFEKNKMICEDDNLDWANYNDYGAKGTDLDWVYKIPVTKRTLLSILRGSAFTNLNMELSPEFYIDINVFAFLGKKDGLLFCPNYKMAEYLNNKFKTFTSVLDLEADHDLIGVEKELTDRIVKWIYERK
ncbi:MAG: hypothetical protein IJB57_00905 [Clostridia bacterium]|nr:hypothetical protein [Clostridia bacterium]